MESRCSATSFSPFGALSALFGAGAFALLKRDNGQRRSAARIAGLARNGRIPTGAQPGRWILPVAYGGISVLVAPEVASTQPTCVKRFYPWINAPCRLLPRMLCHVVRGDGSCAHHQAASNKLTVFRAVGVPKTLSQGRGWVPIPNVLFRYCAWSLNTTQTRASMHDKNTIIFVYFSSKSISHSSYYQFQRSSCVPNSLQRTDPNPVNEPEPRSRCQFIPRLLCCRYPPPMRIRYKRKSENAEV